MHDKPLLLQLSVSKNTAASNIRNTMRTQTSLRLMIKGTAWGVTQGLQLELTKNQGL